MIEDLSNFHSPIEGLFPSPRTDDEWRPFQLTDDQVAHFHEHGYVAGIDVLTNEQIDALRSELSEFFKSDHEGREYWHEYHANESADPNLTLFHALGAWRIGNAFHDLLWHPAVLMAASQLLGGNVRFWHDQLFCKPAQHGGVVAWHQDFSYWTRTAPMSHLTCWIGLDESTRDNGCLQYVPGSHQWELLPITGLAGDMDAIREVLTDEQHERLMNPVAIELKPGQCSFHHPLMVHGSRENKTERPRRAAVLNFCGADVCSNTSEPLLEGVPAIPPGEPLGGQFFPLLYDRCSAD